MGENMDELVVKWLQDLYGDAPLPSFNKNNDFIKHLYQIMEQEIIFEKKIISYQKFTDASAKDYAEDLNSKLCIVKELNLGESVTCPSADLASLASISDKLSLATLDEASFSVALTELTVTQYDTSTQEKTVTRNLEKGAEELIEAAKLNKRLESLLTETSQIPLDEKSLTRLSRDTAFLVNKKNKYQADKRKHEASLAKSGITNNLTHKSIVEDHHALMKLGDELSHTQEELLKFSNLPPDKDLARVKLEVAKLELKEIEDKLVNEIDMYNL